MAAAFSQALDSFGLGGGAVTDLGFFDTTLEVVPEPGTGLLLSLGLAALAWDGRRRDRGVASRADAERQAGPGPATRGDPAPRRALGPRTCR